MLLKWLSKRIPSIFDDQVFSADSFIAFAYCTALRNLYDDWTHA